MTCTTLPLAHAGLIQLGRWGWSAEEAGLASADGRLVRLVVASKGGWTIRAEGETGAAAWGAALERAGLDGGRNGAGQGGLAGDRPAPDVTGDGLEGGGMWKT
ncbi:hypothetical protein [Tautonia plasticadhaerens]|uniref:Uncharacterized protein n=1 Tax=Tautonia plasticadhaerens TaxID=2527974 RepID=A0A518HFM6_9BACT|nr:hypothetical protein [Tautonia plasticadhaerens]QDV39596.1 hypothetical protein ElP_75670 [Tautonia plasticadhaerens]